MAITPTYEALQTITLGTGTFSITFSNIPATYRDLSLVINGGRDTGTAGVQLRFNGDSGSNYRWLTGSGDGTNDYYVNSDSYQTFMPTGWYGNFNPTFTHLSVVEILEYASTDKFKTIFSRSNRAGQGVDFIGGNWASLTAINSIQVILGGSIAGTTVSLYGIEA